MVSVALGVPIGTVERVRPRHPLAHSELLDVEERYRGALFRGLFEFSQLDTAAFQPPQRVLHLKTVSGPDLGTTQFRSGHAKPPK